MNREEARNHLAEWLDEKMWRCFGTIDREAISVAVQTLQDRPHGEWIVNDIGMFECSNCKTMAFSKSMLWNYCPYCGAYMRGGEME